MKIEMTKSGDFVRVYATGAVGGYMMHDFRIAFYIDSPKSVNGSVVESVERLVEVEVVLSPVVVKELSRWLASHVEKYEKILGETKTVVVRKNGDDDLQGYS